ncbi:F-box/LRR-repeat protein At3g58900-like [Fagus crenata]
MDEDFPKFRKKKNANETRKEIDNLPDLILVHILSYLPTKDAVRTSILSKKWQYLWTSTPKLHFAEGERNERMVFMNFVERALALRDSSKITDFSLSCDVQCDTSRINAWIISVVKHKVQVLHMYLRKFQEPLALPPCLFTCRSLEVLKLKMFHHLKLPSSISFSSLKILSLWKVIFSDNRSTQQLFSGCPILEKLSIIDCIWKNVKAVCISSPKLQELFISDRYLFEEKYGENDDKDDLNADADDQKDFDGCKVVIFGTSLESFSFNGELINDYCLYNSSSIVKASLEVFEREELDNHQDAHRVFKLLRGLASVENLKLSSGIVEVLNYAEELFAHLPAFHKLTSLSLEGVETLFTCEPLLNMLQNSRLEFLDFEMDWLPSYDGDYDWVLDPVPSCFVTHLKTIQIHPFSGGEYEMHAVKILLECALVLERIVIVCDESYFESHGGLKKHKEIYEQILLFPRGSMSCEVDFLVGFSARLPISSLAADT